MKLDGLDAFVRQLDDAQKALQEIEGNFGQVKLDPNDPASIEAALAHMNQMIDERLGPHASNPIIGPLIEHSKEAFREGILKRASEARLETKDD